MGVEDPLAGTDSFVAAIAGVVAGRMTTTGLPGGGLRERNHLDPFTKDEVERRVGLRPASRTLRTSDFPGLGPVDVVVAEPRSLIELKWAYQSPRCDVAGDFELRVVGVTGSGPLEDWGNVASHGEPREPSEPIHSV